MNIILTAFDGLVLFGPFGLLVLVFAIGNALYSD